MLPAEVMTKLMRHHTVPPLHDPPAVPADPYLVVVRRAVGIGKYLGAEHGSDLAEFHRHAAAIDTKFLAAQVAR